MAPLLGTSSHSYIDLKVTHHCSATKPNNKSQRTIWRYELADFDRANELLDEVDWEELLNGDVDQMWIAWEEKLMSVMHQCIPTAKLVVKSNVPWINKDIIKARNLSFRHVKRTGRVEHQNDYEKSEIRLQI